MWLYRVAPKVDRLSPNGYNELEVTRRAFGQVPDPYNAEPRNEAMSAQFERQPMPNGPVPVEANRDAPESELDRWSDRMHAASQDPDNAAWDKAQHAAAQD